MASPYISEIRIFSFGFPPKGWAFCNGQLLPIAQNQALFSLLGTSYGGDGQSTFGLPNLQAGVALHGGGNPAVGTKGGSAQVVLSQAQIPAHTHSAIGSSNAASLADPLNAFWATTTQTAYSSGGGTLLASQAITSVGNNLPHQNMSPYLVLNYCIALQGIFPSRS